MKGPAALARALLCASAPAGATATCSERCGLSLGRCSATCGVETRCVKRCNEGLERCVASCNKTDKPVAERLPAKCPGVNGKTVPCSDYQKAPKLDYSGKTQQQPKPKPK